MATQGVSCGVYSNSVQWQSLFGGVQYQYGTNLPLWYPRYPTSQSPTFSDFVQFGGWTRPVMKQYAGSVTQSGTCGVSLDLDYAPSFY